MAPAASRRFHEAGVGSRTGLRLSAVARDQDGFEDLEAFYKASEAALDHRPQPDNTVEDEDEDDYDSFDETRFSRTSTHGRRQAAAASSSFMDIQNSSAPSPRSLLRAARLSGQGKGSNITLADDDDDVDLPNLSTGSRSFDLGTTAMDDDDTIDPRLRGAPTTPTVPARGFSERQASKSPVKSKAFAATRRIELSDSEDDAVIGANFNDNYAAYGDDDQDEGPLSDYDIIPVRPSPAKAKTVAPAPKTKSPARSAPQPAARKRAEPVASLSRSQQVASTSYAPQPPKQRLVKPSKKQQMEPEPMQELAYDEPYDGPEFYPAETYSPSPSPHPQPPPPQLQPSRPGEPPKRKRGRPPKDRSAEQSTYDAPQPLSKSRVNGVARPAASRPKVSKSTSRKAGEVVEKVRSQQGREASVYDENGVRRSTRQRFAPLEYWRGERIRYGRPSLPSGTTIDDLRRSQRPGEDEFEDDPAMMLMRRRVPVLDVKEVIRVPRAPGEGTFAGTTRAKATRRRAVKSEDRASSRQRSSYTPDGEFAGEEEWLQLDPTADTVNVEDGWDAKTVETGLIIDDEEDMEVEMSIVRTKASLRPIAAANQQFRFEKLFNCGGLMATGILELPPGTRKPTKPSKDNSFVFCVLQGALRATVHRKSFIVGPKGIFQVPSGNTYSLENICERDVHLFFAQCRKTKKANAGDLTTFTQMSDTSYGGTPKASSSSATAMPVLGSGKYAPRNARQQEVEEEVTGTEEEPDEEGASEVEPEYEPMKKPSRSTKVIVPSWMVPKSSDPEDSEEDDFETSRQVKSKKKRVFRKL